MDKADKKQISRHTSICISTYLPLSFTHTHSLSSFAHKHPKINSSLQCMRICMHKHTDTGEWVCRQATFISLQSKKQAPVCVHSLTCDTELILSKILEEAQRIKQSIKSLLCWIKKIMGDQKIRLLNSTDASVLSVEYDDWLEPHIRAHVHAQGYIFILVCA